MSDQGGSVEVGGNGLCYSCGKNLAMPGGWNCAKCKGTQPTPGVSGTRSIEEIQRLLLQRGEEVGRKAQGNKIFGYDPDDPLVRDLI